VLFKPTEHGRLDEVLVLLRVKVVVGRVEDDELLEDQLPPSTPAYLGGDPDPVLDG
jgi:hypothetical protein